jgi:hypothetical protein
LLLSNEMRIIFKRHIQEFLNFCQVEEYGYGTQLSRKYGSPHKIRLVHDYVMHIFIDMVKNATQYLYINSQLIYESNMY